MAVELPRMGVCIMRSGRLFMFRLWLFVALILIAGSVMGASEVLDSFDIEDSWIHSGGNSGNNWGGTDWFVTDLIASGVFILRVNTDDIPTSSVVDSVNFVLDVEETASDIVLDLYLGLTDFTEGILTGTAPTGTDAGCVTWDNTYDSAGVSVDVPWDDAGDFGSQDYRANPLDTVTCVGGGGGVPVTFGAGADTAVTNVFQDFVDNTNTIKVLIVAENPSSTDTSPYVRATESVSATSLTITVWYHAAATPATKKVGAVTLGDVRL